MMDYVMTIDSDSEGTPLSKFKVDTVDTEEAPLNLELVFDLSGDPHLNFGEEKVDDLVKEGSKPVSRGRVYFYYILTLYVGSNFNRRHHCTPTIVDETKAK